MPEVPDEVLEVVEFSLDGGRYGVPAARVVEVLGRVSLVPLPGAPPFVAGVFDYRGAPLAAIDMRARFDLPERAPCLDDHFVVARSARRTVALVVDRALGLRAIDPRLVSAPSAPSRHVRGIAATEDGLLLLEDLDAVLSLDEDEALGRELEALADAEA